MLGSHRRVWGLGGVRARSVWQHYAEAVKATGLTPVFIYGPTGCSAPLQSVLPAHKVHIDCQYAVTVPHLVLCLSWAKPVGQKVAGTSCPLVTTETERPQCRHQRAPTLPHQLLLWGLGDEGWGMRGKSLWVSRRLNLCGWFTATCHERLIMPRSSISLIPSIMVLDMSLLSTMMACTGSESAQPSLAGLWCYTWTPGRGLECESEEILSWRDL